MDFSKKRCVACEGDVAALSPMEAEAMLTHLNGWVLSTDSKSIEKKYTFRSYVDAMEFANKITPIAESEGHHPDLEIGWGRVAVKLTTHAIKGLSENDFILAAKIDIIA